MAALEATAKAREDSSKTHTTITKVAIKASTVEASSLEAT